MQLYRIEPVRHPELEEGCTTESEIRTLGYSFPAARHNMMGAPVAEFCVPRPTSLNWADALENEDDVADDATYDIASHTAPSIGHLQPSASMPRQPLANSGVVAPSPAALRKEEVVGNSKRKLKNRTLRREELHGDSGTSSLCSTSSDGGHGQNSGKWSGRHSTSSDFNEDNSSRYFATPSVSSSCSSSDSYFTITESSLPSLDGSEEAIYPYANEDTVANAQSTASGLGEFPSEGSKGHANSTCKPCMFVHTAIGCYKGVGCTFCHFHHKGHARRPCKAKRERYRKLIEATGERLRQLEEAASIVSVQDQSDGASDFSEHPYHTSS